MSGKALAAVVEKVLVKPASSDGINSEHLGGAQLGSLDGSVRFYSETIDAEVFKQLLYGTNDGRNDY